MSERLLRKKDIAEMLATSPYRAVAILSKHGCHAIDFGCGRSNGLRWLESAVVAVIRNMHNEAQPRPAKEKRPRTTKLTELGLANKSAGELHALLTGGEPVQ